MNNIEWQDLESKVTQGIETSAFYSKNTWHKMKCIESAIGKKVVTEYFKRVLEKRLHPIELRMIQECKVAKVY